MLFVFLISALLTVLPDYLQCTILTGFVCKITEYDNDLKKNITVRQCCSGFRRQTQFHHSADSDLTELIETEYCAPMCNKCVHGSCIARDVCRCYSGYMGEHCDIKLCAPGLEGDYCERTCQFGFYGVSCIKRCDCFGGECDSVTGQCVCSIPFSGEKCEKICDIFETNKVMHVSEHIKTINYTKSGHVWRDSNKSHTYIIPIGTLVIRKCINGGTCAINKEEQGVCLCKKGWQGDSCQEKCPPGLWGYNCKQHCKLCSECNVQNGRCLLTCFNSDNTFSWKADSCSSKCSPGTFGPRCRFMCDESRYGEDCREVCKCVKRNTIFCHPQTGDCFCKPQWMGRLCDEECHCVHGYCAGIDGCICDPDWTGALCDQKCPPQYFGEDCADKCPDWMGPRCNITCQCIHGQCVAVDKCICDRGWVGSRCDQMCEMGMFGKQCEEHCLDFDYNIKLDRCDPTYGVVKNYCKCFENGTLRCAENGTCICIDGWFDELCGLVDISISHSLLPSNKSIIIGVSTHESNDDVDSRDNLGNQFLKNTIIKITIIVLVVVVVIISSVYIYYRFKQSKDVKNLRKNSYQHMSDPYDIEAPIVTFNFNTSSRLPKFSSYTDNSSPISNQEGLYEVIPENNEHANVTSTPVTQVYECMTIKRQEPAYAIMNKHPRMYPNRQMTSFSRSNKTENLIDIGDTHENSGATGTAPTTNYKCPKSSNISHYDCPKPLLQKVNIESGD